MQRTHKQQQLLRIDRTLFFSFMFPGQKNQNSAPAGQSVSEHTQAGQPFFARKGPKSKGERVPLQMDMLPLLVGLQHLRKMAECWMLRGGRDERGPGEEEEEPPLRGVFIAWHCSPGMAGRDLSRAGLASQLPPASPKS